LVLTGIGKLHLVDFDSVEYSNLNRQLLFTEQDVGRNKAEVAKEKLKLLNSDVEIHTYPFNMEKLPKDIMKDITIIASCLDTFAGRRWANSLAIREKIPIVLGGMYAFLGDIQVITPYKTACFECQPLISNEKLTQACSPLGKERQELGIEKGAPPLPSVSTVSSIIAGLMSQEIIKLIISIGNTVNHFLSYDGLHSSFIELALTKNDNCPMCGSKYTVEVQEMLILQNEMVESFRYRVALAFGLANPTLMSKGIILRDNNKLQVDEGDKIYITDERLAKPISIAVKLDIEDK
jgi:molybdopterin/thiamine biosynthesis adenylyltransferase